jgi:hypothetical protein
MFNLSTLTDLVSDAADNLIEFAGSEPGSIVSKVFGPAGSAVSTIASTYTRSTEGEQQERTRAQMYSIGPTLSTVRESGGTLDAPLNTAAFESPFSAANVIPFVGRQLFDTLGRTLFRGGGAAAAGGVVGGLLGSGMNGAMDPCCPGAKPFLRFDRCGKPIITRKMKKTIIDAINVCGAEAAAMTYGLTAEQLVAITSKQFPPRRRGISGAQMATAKRVNRALLRNTEKLGYKCTPMASKMK